MLAIRLARVGAKKKPTYRVVVMDKRRARNSKTVEIVGHYNPRPSPMELLLESERIDYWVSKGAQPSDTVRRLIDYKAKGGPVSESGKLAAPVRPAPQEKPPAEKPAAATEAVAAAEAESSGSSGSEPSPGDESAAVDSVQASPETS
jgi:small subunit ribosomal protein S16